MDSRPRKTPSLFSLYRDGFRNMTWGKPLVWLIILKLVILFAVLRVFFFRPAMAGLSEQEKIEAVSGRLTDVDQTQTTNNN
ncbi:MAG: DUF4492 domain-containing protein [Bacteroidales bacterium]|nr:DUF4492 domain-containing protein [Bacteroidales bacterium]